MTRPARHTLPTLALACLALAAAAPPATAQDLHPSRRPSPMAVARATVGDAYVRIVYSRPYKRGRENIFGTAESGALVPYGERWRTGANEATEITLTGDVTVGGKRLAAGDYSLFTTPGPDQWKIHFNSSLGLNGTARRNAETGAFETVDLAPTDVLEVAATPSTLEEEVDQFTIAFDDAEGGADMCLRWILTEVCVPLRTAAE